MLDLFFVLVDSTLQPSDASQGVFGRRRVRQGAAAHDLEVLVVGALVLHKLLAQGCLEELFGFFRARFVWRIEEPELARQVQVVLLILLGGDDIAGLQE